MACVTVSEVADRAVLIDQIHRAPIGEGRRGQAGQRLQRRLVIERRREQGAGLGEHVGRARRFLGHQNASLEHVDVEDRHDGAVDPAARGAVGANAQQPPVVRRVLDLHVGVLARFHDHSDQRLQTGDVDAGLRLAKRPPDGLRTKVEQRSGGDVEAAHRQVDADEENGDLHGAEDVLDVVVHPDQGRVAEAQLVVERAQLLVRRLQLLLCGFQLLVRAAELFIARLRFLGRGGGVIGHLLAIFDGRGQRVPQAVDLRPLGCRCRRALRGDRAAGKHDPTASMAGRRGAMRNHVKGDGAPNVAVRDQDPFPADGSHPPKGETDGRSQHGQDLVMPDQTEEIEGRLSRLQRDERRDFAANAGDLHLFVDQHAARSEMGGQEGIVLAGRARHDRRGRRRDGNGGQRPRCGVEAGQCVCRLALAVDQRLGRDGGELAGRAAETLRASQHQESARRQRVLQQRDRFLLELRVEVDQDVAAGQQIDPRVGRVARHVVRGEDAELPQRLGDLVAAGRRREESR